MLRIGVDVGGTNTDAVIMQGDKLLGGIKSPTTPDVISGVKNAIVGALSETNQIAKDIDAIMIGTTHFINALVERKRLAKTALIRLCLPSGPAILPFSDWPTDLVEAISGSYRLVNGGYEMDGKEISPMDDEQILNAVDELIKQGAEQIAISSVFATVRGDMETAARDLILKNHPDISLSISSDIGKLGLLERENAAIINASLKPLAAEVIEAFGQLKAALGFDCPLYFTRNDGTLIEASEVLRLPVLTFACGPTNSMRGAAFLSGLDHALVADIGGTTTDVGEIIDGFPRLAGTSVTVADVRTNFSMPAVESIGLGGGSLIDVKSMSIGPKSVGHRILQEAVVFGGDTITASDLAVASGRAIMGDKPAPEFENQDQLIKLMDQIVGDAVARSRTSDKQLPVIVVGGGSVLMGDTIDGLKVVRPKNHSLANAVGAAIAQVSGEVGRVVSLADNLSREEAIEQVTNEAKILAISRGAIEESLKTLAVSDMPLSYIPGNNLAINVTVVGDLNLEAHK
ncbi:MAG: hydantoinase/oxoprolinase family protein [Rhizobiales bacterium]|nr:hydantoinase/oxoprolinase family protein [Hyphomicrobiales bacterium]NRB15589.1 hydantoinase/oxoprolinase family protein [Hyphomicrobiales bacterium]